MSKFNRAKNYKTLEFSGDRSQLWAKDMNHLKDLLGDKAEYGLSSIGGWSLFLLDASNVPYYFTHSVLLAPLKISPNADLSLSGRYEFELSGATCRYRYNGGAWSAFAAVVLDGETCNRGVAGSGFDIVFRGSGLYSNTFSVVASDATRVRGGDCTYTGTPNLVRLQEGDWLLNGVVMNIPSKVFVGVTDGDILYLSVAPSTVDYTADDDLSHYKGDGVFLPNPPEATKLTATVVKGTWASIPDDGTTWIIPIAYLEESGGVVNPHNFFKSLGTINELMKNSDPEAAFNLPKTPTGLAVTYGASEFTDLGAKELNGECEMIFSCNAVRDPVLFYEFQITWDAVPSPDEVESFLCKYEEGVAPQIVATGIQAGVTVDVSVRTIDHLGRYSAWATPVSTVTGGTSTITQNPTFTLEKDFGGFWVKNLSFAAATTGLQGISFFVKEGSSPTRTRKDLVRMFKFENQVGEVDEFYIPWAGTDPYVITAPFDTKGVHYFSAVAPTGASIDLTASTIPNTDPGVTFSASRYAGHDSARFIIGSRHANVASVRIHADSYTGAITPSAINFVTEIKCPHVSNAFYPSVDLPKGINYDLAVVGVDKYGIPQTNYNISSIDLREEYSGEFEVGKSSASYVAISHAITQIAALGLSEATIVVHPGTYTEDITLPSSFPAKLHIKGVGLPTIVGDIDWTNVQKHTSSPVVDALKGYSPYSDFGLRITGCNLVGRILKSHVSTAGSDQYGLVLQDSSFTFDNGTTTLPAIVSEQSPGATDNYAVIIFDNVRYYDPEAKTISISLEKSSAGTYASTNILFKNSQINAEASIAIIKKDADDEGLGAVEFRALLGCAIQNLDATGYVYECGSGNLTLAHNAIHCGCPVTTPRIANSGVVLELGTEITNTTRTTDTNVFYDFAFLQNRT